MKDGKKLIIVLLCLFISHFTWAASRGIKLDQIPLAGIGNNNYYALIIGNAAYTDNKDIWKPLKTTITGARALADILKNTYQFSDVVMLENSTRREIILALSDLNRKIELGDNVLVYYAGHGYLDSNSGLGYWVPVDGNGSDHTTFIRNSTIRDELSVIAKRAKHTLLISDSCFSGSLLQKETRSGELLQSDQRYYQRVSKKKSVQIITAGGIEFVDDDYNDSGLSPFTHFLLNELKQNNSIRLTASELAHHVRKAVSSNVKQLPQSGVLLGAGDELGEFIFVNAVIQETFPKTKTVTSKQNRDKVDFNQSIRKRLPFPTF